MLVLHKKRIAARANVALLAILFLASAAASAHTFTTLYNFTGGVDGGNPVAGLVQDSHGNLYGTTSSGGAYNLGVVFKVDTAGKETVLHSFKGGKKDGASSYTPLLLASDGSLYGTTVFGGAHNYGVVFRIDTTGKERIVYSFKGGTTDGCYPYQGLIEDKAGNFYGTTAGCATQGDGTVFKLTKEGKDQVLWNFNSDNEPGAYPFYGHLLMDRDGTLHGVTNLYQRDMGTGVVYQLTKGGALTEWLFNDTDGCSPFGTTVMDESGNVYGTAAACGDPGYGGTVWQVAPDGTWSMVHGFVYGNADGCYPLAGPLRDSDGNLYGNTSSCGAYGYGTLWEFSNSGGYTLTHDFAYTDGSYPVGELLRDSAGKLYGTAYQGGSGGYGTVWVYK